MFRSKQTFSFNPPTNLVEEGKWLERVTFFECPNFVFNITDENNSFSINILRRWNSKLAERTICELHKVSDLKSQNNIDLHVREFRKRGYQIKFGGKEFKLSDYDTFKEEILEELKNAKHNDLEDMV